MNSATARTVREACGLAHRDIAEDAYAEYDIDAIAD